jgi:hypothetical protein
VTSYYDMLQTLSLPECEPKRQTGRNDKWTPGIARRDKIVYRYVLSVLIEAARNRPDAQRFELMLSDQAALVSHPGLPNGELRVRSEDIEILAKKGLITCFGSGALQEFRLVHFPGD